MTDGFHGWRFGSDLTPEQADRHEPLVDIFSEVLKITDGLEQESLESQPANLLILEIMAGTGTAASLLRTMNKLVDDPDPLVNPNWVDHQIEEAARLMRMSLISILVHSAAMVRVIDDLLETP